MFQATCPKCGNGFEAQEEWVGQDGECPSCGSTIRIEKVESKPDPLPSIKDKSFTFICPECGSAYAMQADMVGKETECPACLEKVLVSIPEFRLCPHCGKQIKAAAKVCKHCKLPVSDISILPPDEKDCPHCGKRVKTAARICKHCKSQLELPPDSASRGGSNESSSGNPWGGITFLAFIAAVAYPGVVLFGVGMNGTVEGIILAVMFISLVLSVITSAGKPQNGQG